MAFTGRFSLDKRAYIKLAGRTGSQTAKEVAEECKVSLASVYRVWKGKFTTDSEDKRRKENQKSGGRTEKLNSRGKRSILRNINVLREENSNFTSKKLIISAGVDPKAISCRTVRRVLNQNGYQARKKGVLKN